MNKAQQLALEAADQELRDRALLHSTAPTGQSLTKQADAFDSDINNIVRRHTSMELAHTFTERPGEYLDLSDAADYHRSLEIVRTAEDAFGELSAEVRARFDNDPEKLVAAIFDPAMKDELTKLGVFEAKAPNTPAEKPAEKPSDKNRTQSSSDVAGKTGLTP